MSVKGIPFNLCSANSCTFFTYQKKKKKVRKACTSETGKILEIFRIITWMSMMLHLNAALPLTWLYVFVDSVCIKN